MITKSFFIRCLLVMSLLFTIVATIGADAKGCWGQKLTDRTDITWAVGSSYRPPGGGGGGGNDIQAGNVWTQMWTTTFSAVPPAGQPTVRSGHRMVWDGTRVIMFGGYDYDGFSTGIVNDTWWYNPTDNQWTVTITDGSYVIPAARGDHAMVWDGTRVIMFGGTSDSLNPGRNDLCWYDPNINTWTQQIASGAPGSPSIRANHSMVWDGTRVIMFGGYYGFPTATILNDLWWYDPNTNTWTEQITSGAPGSPPLRYGQAMVWDGTRVIMFGGTDGFSSTIYNDLWWYDPNTNTWTEQITNGAPGSPAARYNHSMVWDGTRVILFSGLNTAPDNPNELWWYDPNTNAWTLMLAEGALGSPPGRNNYDMVWDATRMIMFGGGIAYTGISNGIANDLWFYDP